MSSYILSPCQVGNFDNTGFQEEDTLLSVWFLSTAVSWLSVVDCHLRKLLWVYCPGHAGVEENDPADTLAGKAVITRCLRLGSSEVLRSLRHYLRAQSQGHQTIERLKERGMERGSARRSSLKGRERAIVSQTNIGTVSKATLGKLLRNKRGAHMGFSERIDTTLLNWAEQNVSQCIAMRTLSEKQAWSAYGLFRAHRYHLVELSWTKCFPVYRNANPLLT